MKIATIIGTRPEIVRLACIIKKLDEVCGKYSNLLEAVSWHALIHTGQNYSKSLNDIFFEQLDLRHPDFNLEVVGKNLGETMGNVIAKSYDLLKKLNPDALLILGDTNSSLSVISAKRLKIPIFHMEAGNRCFDQVVPEEINRRIVDHTSDVNLPYTENARRNLIDEGLHANFIFVTGSPLKEVYNHYKEKIEYSNILSKLNLPKNEYIVWSTHREENIDIEPNWLKVIECIKAVAKNYPSKSVIISAHPRTSVKLTERSMELPGNVRIFEPFGLLDYIKLLKNAYCVISDSGTISEEAAILNIPAISFRTSTERPEALDKGNIILSGLDPNNLLSSIKIVLSRSNYLTVPLDYEDINVSEKIVRLIFSYTPIVNKIIWKK
jgi:UDP-N-acetyl-L-fucosamine synthase